MSYNMNENRPKNIGLAGVLRRAVRKITINEKNLLVQDNSNKKNHDENNNHNNNHSNSNSDSHGAENFNNSNTQNNLVKNLLKTHTNLSHDGVHLPYHTLSGYHVKPYPDDEEDNKNPLSITINGNKNNDISAFRDFNDSDDNQENIANDDRKISLGHFKGLFAYLQKKHLIKSMSIVDGKNNRLSSSHLHSQDYHNHNQNYNKNYNQAHLMVESNEHDINSMSAINLDDRKSRSASQKDNYLGNRHDENHTINHNDYDNNQSDFSIHQPDPIAASLLESDYLIALEEELYDKGLRKLGLLENGAGETSLVLDAGEDLVLRLGCGEIIFRPNLEEVLQPVYWGYVGNLRYEILPKVDVVNINELDVASLSKSLAKKGYDWHDASLDNIGIYHSSPIITDPSGIEARKTSEKHDDV